MYVPEQGNKSKKCGAPWPLQGGVAPQDQLIKAEWQELEHDRALIHFLVQTIIRGLVLKPILHAPPRPPQVVHGGGWGRSRGGVSVTRRPDCPEAKLTVAFSEGGMIEIEDEMWDIQIK